MSGDRSEIIRRMAIEVIVALIVMFSVVVVLHGHRIEKECLCSGTVGWVVWGGALLIVLGFLVVLFLLALGAWRRQASSPRVWFKEQRRHVVAAVVPWTMAILGIVLLTVPSQTADMLAGIQGREWADFRLALVPFGLGALAWGMSVWFCGRWSIDIERRTAKRPENWLEIWNPRLLALVTGLAIVFITVKAAGLCSYASLVASVVAGIVFLFAILRRSINLLFDPSWRGGGKKRLARRNVSPEAPKSRWSGFVADLLVAPGGLVVLCLALAASLAIIGIFAYDPQVATKLEAPGTVLLGLACLTMIATFLSKAGLRLTRAPALLICLVATTLLGSLDIGVNHDIRSLPSSTGAVRPTIDEAAAQWLSTCGTSLVGPGDKELKVVLVSTAGGASRAALWTFNALASLEARDRQFPRRVFAISAVSGGALGAAVWSALLAHDDFDCTKAIDTDVKGAQWRVDGQGILEQDFLAPVLAAWMARDVPLGVVPLNIVLRNIGIHAEDRAAALEKAWEAAWPKKFADKPNPLAGNFLSLWETGFNRPLLLLNGTNEDTGQPIVTAPVSIVDEQGKPNGTFPATYDALWALGEDIRTSTATLNAARFPVVTPQGDIRIERCMDGAVALSGKCADGKKPAPGVTISVVDGGYFDNIGGGTTVRAAYALQNAFVQSALATKGISLRIMVVGISSDPDRFIPHEDWAWLDTAGTESGVQHDDVDQLMRCGGKFSTLAIDGKALANTLDAEIAPALAIVATQSGHTALRMAELNQTFCSPKRTMTAPVNYVVLSLCPVGDVNRSISLALNWVLPRATQVLFAGKDPDHLDLSTLCGNAAEFDYYGHWAAGR